MGVSVSGPKTRPGDIHAHTGAAQGEAANRWKRPTYLRCAHCYTGGRHRHREKKSRREGEISRRLVRGGTPRKDMQS